MAKPTWRSAVVDPLESECESNPRVFRVNGNPRPQPRGRAGKGYGGHARVFDPGTAADWKDRVASDGEKAKPESPLEGCVAVSIDLYLKRPKSKMRKKDPDGWMWCPNTGDADNYAKAILDVMTDRGWWRDDKQVVYLEVRKRYHAKDDIPHAVITVEEIG